MASNLARRVGFAAVAIPAALLVVYFGGWPLVTLLAIVGVLGVRELYDLAGRGGVRPSRAVGYVSAAGIAPLAYLNVSDGHWAESIAAAWPFAIAVWLIVLLTWALARRRPADRPLSAAAITLLAVAYAAALPAFLVAIRHGRFGASPWAATWLVFFPLVVTWVCDSAAMGAGKSVGGPKLWPVVSPNTTRSGAIGGVVGALLVGLVFGLAVFPRVGVPASLGASLIIAGVLSVVGQAGDLVESLFKREAGVKDSGTIIPGHGGVLDRFDSLYFVVPAAAALYRCWDLV